MARDNPSNPFTQDRAHTAQDVPLPVQKAKVVSAKGHPGQAGYHIVRIQVYADSSNYLAPVLAPMHGCVWVPKEGQDVAVVFGDSNKPWVIGAWYAFDRVLEDDIDLPDYEPGDIRLGNDTGGHITVQDDGSIDISTGGLEPIDIDHQSASARMSSDQSVAGDSIYHKVNFDTAEHDPEDLFDASDNSFTVRHTGQHRVESTVEIDSAGQNNTYRLALFENGSVIKRKIDQSVVSAPMSVHIATTRQINGGDVLDIRLQHDSSSDRVINSSNVATEFSIERHGI